MKLSKLIYRIDKWARNFSSKKEKCLSADPENKEYIRAKRNLKHLPDSWTNTRWIHKVKSWKKRSKKKHQYEKHVQSEYELNSFYNNVKLKQEFLFKLETLYKKDGIGWYYFPIYIYNGNYYYHYVTNYREHYYDVALELYKEGLIYGECYINKWKFVDFGIEKEYTQEVLIKCRINPDIL